MHKILSGAEKPTLPNLATITNLPLLSPHALTPTYSNSQNSPKLLSPFSSAKPRRLSLHAVFRTQLKQSKTAEVLPPEEELKGDIEDPILKEVSLWKEHSRGHHKEGRRLSKTSSFPVNDLHGSLDFAGSLIRSPRNFGNFDGLSPIRGSKHTEELTTENSPFAAEGLLKIQERLVPIPEDDKVPFPNNIKKPAKTIYRKSSRIHSDSSANSSFDKDLVRLNLKQDDSDEESNANTIKSLEDLVSPKNAKRNHLDSAQILTSQETSTTRKVPLARLIRRKSCCCTECGNLSELEKKHQNLAGLCAREELNRFKEALLKKDLKQRPQKEASFHLDDSPKEEKEEFMVPPMTESPLGTKCLAIPSAAFGELESPLNSRMISKTEADQEKVVYKKSLDSPGRAKKFVPFSTTSATNSKKSISSKNNSKPNSKASVEPVVRSPKTFVVKHVKEPSSQSSPSIKASLQIPSIKFGEKSGQASPSLLKVETTPSRNMDSRRLSSFFAYSIEENMAMHSEQQPKITTIKNLYTVRNNREESRDSRNSKDSKDEGATKFHQSQKNNTLSRFNSRKGSEPDAMKTNKVTDSLRLATLGDFEKTQTGFISPKVRTAMRKYSIQGIYTGSITSINSTPKLPSIQSSPTSKLAENLLVPKKQSSSKPKINIIITKDTDKIRVTPKDSPKGMIAGSLEVQTGGTPRKTSTSTLDTLSMPTIYNNNKQRKSWFGTMNMQLFTEKDQETIKTEVDEEGEWRAYKEKRRGGDHLRKKKASSKKKRSSSLEKVLKAYQQSQGKKKVAN